MASVLKLRFFSLISFLHVQVKKDEVQDVEKRSEIAAVSFWLINNSKKCPNCKSPIEKNEGCNHMKCSKVSISYLGH